MPTRIRHTIQSHSYRWVIVPLFVHFSSNSLWSMKNTSKSQVRKRFEGVINHVRNWHIRLHLQSFSFRFTVSRFVDDFTVDGIHDLVELCREEWIKFVLFQKHFFIVESCQASEAKPRHDSIYIVCTGFSWIYRANDSCRWGFPQNTFIHAIVSFILLRFSALFRRHVLCVQLECASEQLSVFARVGKRRPA